MRPRGGSILPSNSATYSLRTVRAANCPCKKCIAASCLATTITPDVPLSSRWDDAGPPFAADPLQFRAMVQHGINERIGRVPRSRMHHKAGLLVDDQQVVVFIDDVKGNLLRL